MGIYANTNNAIGSPFQANQQQKQLVKYVPDRVCTTTRYTEENLECSFICFRLLKKEIGWRYILANWVALAISNCLVYFLCSYDHFFNLEHKTAFGQHLELYVSQNPDKCPFNFIDFCLIDLACNLKGLKVSKSRKHFMISQILPKNKPNSLSWASSLFRIVSFVCFLGESRRP